MARKTRITPCLWFASEALEAARYYVGIFRNSRVRKIMRYGKAGQEQHGQKAGSVLMVAFELDGRPFTALNGGPIFKFNEAVSLQVYCRDQKEVDYYWKKLGAGGDPKSARSQRAFAEMMRQKKPDIAAVQKAYDG